MRCEHYWRDGVLLVEQGHPDPHRDNCLDCRREHEARQELVRAFLLVGANDPGEPDWQRHVWRRISREASTRAPGHGWAWASGALVAASVLAVIVLSRSDGDTPGDGRPRVETIPSAVAKRSTSASVGDRVRVSVLPTQEVRLYRAEKLVLRCAADAAPAAGCTRDEGGLVAELELALPGEYQILIVLEGTARLEGTFDRDAAALTSAGSTYQVQPFPVR